MTVDHGARVLTVVVCAAGPATQIQRLVDAAHSQRWAVSIIATPAAVPFLDIPALETLTSSPVRSQYRTPDQPRNSAPPPQALIVAPATYNTICKLASGISDNYALGTIAEAIGRRARVVILPFVNTALAARAPFTRAVEHLRTEGVRILYAEGEWQPHPPGTGDLYIASYPWQVALDAAAQP